jgi:enoyl-CoA hydratase/carnithine racemase
VAMYQAMVDALARAEDDPEVRVIVFAGAGGAFTSGNDLMDFMQQPPTGEDSPVFRFLLAIAEGKKPTMAAVRGPAIGIGSTMLLHTDLVYAADDARFRLPFVDLGLVPEGASSFLLPRLAGYPRAADLLLFGEMFDAATARDAGLVAEVLPSAALDERVAARARTLADKPLGALIDAKRLLRASTRDAVRDAMRREGEIFMGRLTSPEAMEAMSAFFEKRKPDFRSIKPGA